MNIKNEYTTQKSNAGAPKKESAKKISNQIKIGFTDTEKNFLKSHQENAGYPTLSKFLHDMILEIVETNKFTYKQRTYSEGMIEVYLRNLGTNLNRAMMYLDHAHRNRIVNESYYNQVFNEITELKNKFFIEVDNIRYNVEHAAKSFEEEIMMDQEGVIDSLLEIACEKGIVQMRYEKEELERKNRMIKEARDKEQENIQNYHSLPN